MSTATTRILRLLSLLQSRRDWSGIDLGERLEVDVRTVRRDVDRLRQLGYVIESSAGVGGGYRMGAGTSTPPLLLNDDEVTAVVVALSAAAGSIAGLQETALGVLLKLDQILPNRLRTRLSSFESATLTLPHHHGATVDWKVLTALTAACREHEELEFDYQDKGGQASSRCVEPLHVVHTGRLWYLVAWDTGRGDFRTFRVDRIEARRVRSGARFTPRALPEDLATYVARSLSVAQFKHQVRVQLAGTPEELTRRVPPWVGLLEASGPRRSTLTLGGNDYESLAAHLLHMGVPFERVEPPEAAQALSELALRVHQALEKSLAPRGTNSTSLLTTSREKAKTKIEPRRKPSAQREKKPPAPAAKKRRTR